MRSLLIHPSELSVDWIDRMVDNGTDVLGIHPEGGVAACESLEKLLREIQTKEYRSLIDYAIKRGLKIEYEIHSVSYLLPRALFDSHPEYFRMVDGERVADTDFCISNTAALSIVCEGAAELVARLYGSSDTYYLWLDDVKAPSCQCEQCKHLSASDKNLLLMNAIIKRLREDNKNARLAYLAYYATATPPTKVLPEKGIFLEYAPLGRKMDVPMSAQAEQYEQDLKGLISFFGKENSKVLEYWFDNSMFSKWKKPPVKFTPNRAVIEEDIKYYEGLGFENVASFACFLGSDYEALYGKPDVTPFAQKR